MTSHTTRLPSPPPPEDSRVLSPARVDSPPAPSQTLPRQDAPVVSVADANITRSVDPPTEPAAPIVNAGVSPETPLARAVSTTTPTPAEDVSISAPSETIVPP